MRKSDQQKLELLPLTAPEYLSPSSISTFQQCPLKFKYSKIDGLPDPSGKEALLGNFVHAVLEDLYHLAPEERTIAVARDLAREQWANEWADKITPLIRDPKELNAFRWNAWDCIENIWKLENPKLVSPYKIESFVRGEIAGVKIHGYIDRISSDLTEAKVTDYKTGKTPRRNYLDDKFFQLIVYSRLLSSIDILTDSVKIELLYLKDAVRFEKKVEEDDIFRTEEIISTTKSQIDEACITGEFEHRPSRLCDWCGYKKICPAWQ